MSYHMGGIPTNEFGEVEDAQQGVIEGLYAVGECAAASFHGFNRLGTNSILELITMGKTVGDRVIEHLKREPGAPPDMKGDRFREKFEGYFAANGRDNIGLIRNVRRYDPDQGRSWVQTYSLKAGRIMRFVDLFRRINDEQDPTLAWGSSCEHGQCGTCSMKINGKPLLACELLVENAVAYFGTTVFNVEPLDVAPVIRDLVIDTEKAYERINRVKPYIISPKPPRSDGREQVVSPKALERYVSATRCINCFCCASACIGGHGTFLGPNAMLAAIVRVMDSREQEKQERLRCLYSDEGIYRCHSSRACSFVCPKEIDVAHFIALAKAGALGSE